MSLSFSAQGQKAALVSVSQISEQPIVRTINAAGTVTSPRAAAVSAAIGGLIATYDADVGDLVEAGDRLVQLDAEVSLLELESARAREAEAMTALADARRRLADAEKLSGERGVIAKTEVESLRAEVGIRESELAVARADTRRQQALVKRHAVRAPFAGVVSERAAEIGEWVNPGDALLELVAIRAPQFDFRLPQSAYNELRQETSVEVRLDAVPGQTFAARISAIVPVKNPTDRTFLVRAVLAETERDAGEITPGMSVNGMFAIQTGRSAVVVPRDALLRYPDGRQVVWVATRDADEMIVREKRVQTGLEFDGQVEITSGLTSGMQVVVRGNETLRDGQPVEIR